jgi:Protein of unknown function (DUF2948)
MAPDEGPPPSPGSGLKLRAEDAEDLAVLSATLQDAVVAVRDLAFLADEERFVLVASRFRWERGFRFSAGEAGFERILCAVAFEGVAAVSYRGFRRSDEDRILSLLSIRFDPGRPHGAVHLDFSGGAGVRLEVARIACRSRDLGEPWPTPWRPRHDEEEGPP